MPDEAPEELNAAILLDINAELSTKGDKPSDAEILTEIRGKVNQKEEIDEINVVHDEPSEPQSALEVNKAIEALQQLRSVTESQQLFAKSDSETKKANNPQ